MLIIVPQILASCPRCGCLVIAQSFASAEGPVTVVWDPAFTERRGVRSLLAPGDVERQGFASLEARPHECVPDSQLRLPGRPEGGRA